MMLQSVLGLINQTPAAGGVFEARTETVRTVFCAVKSVGAQEFYTAREHDLLPALVFVLADYAEYRGEPICEYNGVRYRIIRTYITPQLRIELTAERAEELPPATTEGAITE